MINSIITKIYSYILLLPFICGAQSNISWLNSWPQGNDLTAVEIIDHNTVFIIGDFGTVIKTEDAGNSWNVENIVDYKTLNSISFADKNNGWIVGDQGTIFKTADSGKNWLEQFSRIEQDINKIFVLNAYLCFAACDSGIILKTTDGGENWQKTYLNSDDDVKDIFFLSDSLGWAVGPSDRIYKTTDQGHSWSYSEYLLEPGKIFSYIYFTDPNIGWVKDQWNLFKTYDSGITWEKELSHVSSVVVLDTVIWTVTHGGLKPYPNDLEHWQFLYGFKVADGFLKIKDENFWYVANNGYIAYSDDGANSWNEISKRNEVNYRTVDISPANKVLAISKPNADGEGSFQISAIDNLGKEKVISTIATEDLRDLHFYSEDSIWVFGSEIFLSTDAGFTWERNQSEFTSVIYETCIIDDVFWAVGLDGLILTSENFGESWIKVEIGTSDDLISLSFINKQTGWIGTRAGSVIFTDDGGENWKTIFSDSTQSLTEIWFLNEQTGFAFGTNIYKTINGGQKWDIVYSGIDPIHAIQFFDDLNAIAVGLSGLQLETTDGGLNWKKAIQRTDKRLTDIAFWDNNNGFVVGEGGLFLRYGDSKLSISAKTLLIDADFDLRDSNSSKGVEEYYNRALFEINENFHYHNLADSSLEKLSINKYEKVILFTGGRINPIIDSSDLNILTNYLDSGGNLFLTGQNILGSNKNHKLFNEYLDLSLIADTASTIYLNSIEGNPISGQFYPSRIHLYSYTGARNQFSYNAIELGENHIPLFQYENDNRDNAACAFYNINKDYKIVFFAFGFEALPEFLNDWHLRTDLMRNIYSWFDGTVTHIENQKNNIVNASVLEMCYPNPFNPNTKIPYSLAHDSFVKLIVFDALGRKVESLVDEFQRKGNYEMTLSASTWSSGVYFYRLETGQFVKTRKMILIK